MPRKLFTKRTLTIALSALLAIALLAGPRTRGVRTDRLTSVSTIRVPNRGIQPQVIVDGKGVLHMIYFSGDQGHGDLSYVRSMDQGATFSSAVKVNSHPGSAIAARQHPRGAYRAW